VHDVVLCQATCCVFVSQRVVVRHTRNKSKKWSLGVTSIVRFVVDVASCTKSLRKLKAYVTAATLCTSCCIRQVEVMELWCNAQAWKVGLKNLKKT